MSRSYARLNFGAPWVGVDLQRSDTPLERAEAIARAVPESAPAVRQIVSLYVQEQYTSQRLSLVGRYDTYRKAREAWSMVRRVFLRAALLRWLGRLTPGAGDVRDIRIR